MTWRTWVIAIGGAVLLTVPGCGSDEIGEPLAGLSVEDGVSDSENRAPVIRDARFDPSHPTLDDRFRASVSVFDPEGEPVEVEYEWWLDGEPLALSGPEPTDLDVAVGSSIEFAATASDGRLRSEPVRAKTRIQNRVPRITGLGITPPQRVTPGRAITATPMGEDPDGSLLSFRYRWSVNGETVDESEDVFSTEGLKRGDRIRVAVVASDGVDDSRPFESADIVVGSAYPEITSLPPEPTSSIYRYEVEAIDPDGGSRLTYRLAKAPEGMTVDPHLGVVEWTPTHRHAGVHTVSVVVKSASGLETTQTFDLTVGENGPANATP